MAEVNFKPQDCKLPGLTGINTLYDAQFIQDTDSPSMTNIVFDGGFIAPRPGTQLLSEPPVGETSKPQQLILASTMDGIQYMVGVWGTHFYAFDDSSVQWIRINNTNIPTVTGIYYGSVSWLQALNDARIYFGNGVDACQKWIVSIGTLANSASSSDETIVLTDSSRLPASGTLVIKGTSGEFTVTISGNDGAGNVALSAPLGQNVPAGSIVAMDTTIPMGDNSSSFPKGRILQIFANRMFVTNSKTDGITIYYSTNTDPEDFTISTSVDSGGSEHIADGFGQIIALHNFGTFLVIEKQDTIQQFNIVVSSDGSTKTDQITPMVTSQSYGPVNSTAVGQINNALVYLTRNNGIVQVYPSYAGTVVGVQINVLSQNIQNLLTNGSFDFTNVRVAVKEQKVLFACALRGSTQNTQVLMYDFIRKAWTRFSGWAVADWILRNDELYYLDNSTGEVNECFTNNYSDNSNPYPVEIYTKIFDYGIAGMPKTVGRVFIQGYMQTAADFFIDVMYNNQGRFETQTFRINKDTPRLFLLPALTDELGTFLPGATPSGWADLSQVPDVRPFYCGLGVDMRKGFFNIQFRVYSNKAAFWGLTVLTPFVHAMPNFPPEIMIDSIETTGITTTQTVTVGPFTFAFEPLLGINDGVNTVFTVTHVPSAVVVNGFWYFPIVDYTIVGTTITLPFAPVKNSTLMGIYIL